MLNKFSKKYLYFLPLIILLVIFVAWFNGSKQNETKSNNVQRDQRTDTLNPDTSQNTEIDTSSEKIIPGDTLCSQITKEFVVKVTGVPIARVSTINDFSITACNYYLADENNSPFIAVILNKNLNMEVQKNYAIKQKLTLVTDSRIVTEHYIAKSLKDDRIVNINLILDQLNFIRIDRNVERAVDNEGLIKLAIEISKRL